MPPDAADTLQPPTGSEGSEEKAQRYKDLHGEAGQRELALSLAIERLDIPVLVIDAGHVITHCSKAYERLAGIPAGSLIGTKDQWRTFFSEPGPVLLDLVADQAPEAEIMARFGPGCRRSPLAEDAWEVERFLPAPDGGGKWFLFTAVPLQDENARVTGAVETFREVTKGHRMQDALRRTSVRLQTLVDFIPYPIGVFTMDGHPTYLNPYFTKVFGWTLEDFQAGRVPFVPFDQVQSTLEELKRLRQDKILVHQIGRAHV